MDPGLLGLQLTSSATLDILDLEADLPVAVLLEIIYLIGQTNPQHVLQVLPKEATTDRIIEQEESKSDLCMQHWHCKI